MTLRLHAPAKINLFLHVTGRRPDGYHLLESLVAFADIGDELTVEAADAVSLSVDGDYAAPAGHDNNLVLKAARLLQRHGGVTRGAHMHLRKNLPVAAGLGGGSSDAAAALRGLSQLWACAIPDAAVLAAELGADVPVCLHGRPAMMRGIGEDVSDAGPLAPCGIVLVNPGRAVATVDVFRALRPPFTQPFLKVVPGAWRVFDDLIAGLKRKKNDLTAPASAIAPAINDVLTALTATGCALARMSGSGATCFALYPDAHSAVSAANVIAAAHPAWWTKAGQLVDGT